MTFPLLQHAAHQHGLINRLSRLAKGAAITAVTFTSLVMTPAHAEGPGRGQTAQFERDYLTFIIDHHYSALRMTELAAGTDTQRNAPVENPEEGTSPTPSTQATPAKAGKDDIKSLARMANRMQREEILEAQKYLRDWYGATHTPTLRPEAQQLIQQLEQAPAGAQFEQTFLRLFSNHHYVALQPSLDCQIKSELEHDALREYCEGIVQSQVRQINNMRDMLCRQFSVCDYQPSSGTPSMQTSAMTLRNREDA